MLNSRHFEFIGRLSTTVGSITSNGRAQKVAVLGCAMLFVCLLSFTCTLTAHAEDIAQSAQAHSTPVAPDPQRAAQWFARYDEIRRKAQMTPSERQQADELMSKGISAALGAGQDSTEAKQLLGRLVNRYQTATQAMRQLPIIPETEQLHRGYYQYFQTAADLFSNYLTLQGNLFATDESGQPLIPQLMARKTRLESLNTFIQDLDTKTRNQFHIPAYTYRPES